MTFRDSNDYGPYVSTGKSIRQIVFELMVDNKDITPSQIMGILKLSYGYETANKQTIKNYMMEWRNRNYLQARPLRPHRRVFRWFVVRTGEFEERALRLGWVLAKNRNRMLIYRYDYGSVHWMLSGNVFVYLRGMASLARVKETFSRAFMDVIGKDECLRQLEAPLRELGRQMVFDLGQPLPRFEIRYYEKSHGLRIYSDGSHPTAIEVAETEPFWLTHFEGVVTKLGEEITEHLKLVQVWRREAESRQHQYELEQQRDKKLEQNLLKLQKSVAINSKATLTLTSLIARRRSRQPKKPTLKKKHGIFHSLHKRLQKLTRNI